MESRREPLPEWIRERIMEKVQNRELAKQALEYLYLIRKEDGTVMVAEEFRDTDKHALWFMVLACVNYAQRLLRGEDIDDL